MMAPAVLILVLFGLALRVAWFFTPAGYPDADEAVFGLMALHIQQGREHPLYFWDAHYGGTAASYLAAVGYSLIGMGAPALKSATLPFVAGYLCATYGMARLLLDARSALVALAVAAVPPATALTLSVKAAGGYPETLCFGSLVLLLAFRLPASAQSAHDLRRHLALLGLVGGFGLYIFPLIIPYLVVAGWFLYRHHRPALSKGNLAWLVAGGLAGVSPMLVYNLQHSGATVLRLGSRVFNVSRADAASAVDNPAMVITWLGQYVVGLPEHLASVVRNVGPLLDLDGATGLVVAWSLLGAGMLALARQRPETGSTSTDAPLGRWCALVAPVTLVFAWVAGLDRPRHLSPLFSLLPLGIAALYGKIAARRRILAHGLLVLVLAASAWTLAAEASRWPVKPVEPLVETMRQLDIRGAYADYEIAYLTMFATREAVLASPTAWSQAAGLLVDRTPEITREVDRLPNPAYVFFHDRDEALWFAEGLARRRIAFDRRRVGEFELFWNLSVPVRSADLPVSRGW